MKSIFTHVAAALAVGLATTSGATGVFQGSTDFEGMPVGALPSDGFFAGSTVDSSIVSNAAVAAQVPSDARPANFDYADSRDKVLSVDADMSAPLLRYLKNGGTPETIGADSVYADMLVDFAQVGGTNNVPEPSPADQILVYARETAENGAVVGTNLYVFAGNADGTGSQEYKLTAAVEAGVWTRIVVKAVADVRGISEKTWPGFEIYLGGAASSNLCQTAGGQTQFLSLTADGSTAGAVSALAFAGTGCVDDLVLSSVDPESSDVLVTLSWPTSLREVAYVVDGATNALTVADGTATVTVPDGSAVSLIGAKAREIEDSVVVSGAPATLALPADGVEWYFPQTATAGQDGSASNPFEIATAGDLYTLADLVQTTNCAGLYFQQVASIDFTDEAPFSGIGTYDPDPRLGTPFTGVYDGGDYFISDVTFTARNYGGLFNQVNGGTVKNLYVSNAWVSATATGEYGFAIVGNAGNGATLQNLCSLGTFGTPEKPGTHNMAGIVVRVSGGGEDGTLVQGCVNAADVYGTYTKIAGVCAIAQHKADGAPVRFDICSNSGDIVAMDGGTAGRDGVAGIVAYSDDDVVISDCFNTGSLSSTLAAAKIGEIVGYHKSRALTGEGRIGASADRKMIHTEIDANLTGFDYAVVDDGRAETTDTLEAAETYLLERSIADSGEPVFELENAGDWIAFDTKFGYTFLGEIAFADGEVAVATNGTVITYTAAVPAAGDPWFTPDDGAGAADIADSLSQAGLSSNTNVIQSTADYVALVDYVTNHVAGATEPSDLTANQKANAVLCYALGATSIPDAVIDEMEVETVAPAANGTMTIAISIDGLEAGALDTAAAQALATRVLSGSVGGDDVSGLSEDNVAVQVTGSDDGKILATVAPDPNAYVEPPAAFFVKPVVLK